MILAMSLVRRGLMGDPPLGVGREVGNDRTYQKRGIVIHDDANAEPFAQPDVKAAADRQRQSGIGMGVSVMDGAILGNPPLVNSSTPPVKGFVYRTSYPLIMNVDGVYTIPTSA